MCVYVYFVLKNIFITLYHVSRFKLFVDLADVWEYYITSKTYYSHSLTNNVYKKTSIRRYPPYKDYGILFRLCHVNIFVEILTRGYIIVYTVHYVRAV